MRRGDGEVKGQKGSEVEVGRKGEVKREESWRKGGESVLARHCKPRGKSLWQSFIVTLVSL